MELAVFGALLIGLLATLISYGLRNKYQQQALQQTFRKALAVTHEKLSHKDPGHDSINLGRRGSASYVYVRDRHTPDPTNPFGTGSVSPYTHSVSITRDYRMNEVALYPEELPIVVINIPNQNNQTLTDQLWTVTVAGFSDKCVPKQCPEGPIKKYDEIYGYNNFWKLKKGEDRICQRSDRYGILWSCTNVESGDPIPCNVTAPLSPGQDSEGYVYRSIDYCEGDIMNYDACTLQCNKFKEQDVNDPDNICVKECARSRMDWVTGEEACKRICEAKTETPWYCSHLDIIFPPPAPGVKPKDMGLQDDRTTTTTRSSLMQKTEQNSGIATTDIINRSDTIDRVIVIIRKVYGPGGGVTSFSPKHEVAPSSVSQSEDIDLDTK